MAAFPVISTIIFPVTSLVVGSKIKRRPVAFTTGCNPPVDVQDAESISAM